MPDSPLKRRFTTRSLLGRESPNSHSPKSLAPLDINAANSATDTVVASAADVYKLGCELNELRRELARERAANAELKAQKHTQQQHSSTPVLMANGLPRPRRPSSRSSSSLRHSTASSASNSSAVTPDDEMSLYMSNSAALPRSKGNLALSQTNQLDAVSDSPGSPMLAHHMHGASLSKIPKFAVGMNRTLTGTHYDVSRSKSPLPEEYTEEQISFIDHGIHDDAEDVFAVPPLPDPQTTPSTKRHTHHSRAPSSASKRRSIIPISINSPAPLSQSQSSSASSRSMSSSQGSTKTTISPNLPFSTLMAPSASKQSTSSASSAFSSSSNCGQGRGKGGVFFGSSDQVGARHAARVQSAASGTGKVLSELQVDLATVRGALETTKNQLRVASRANESLSMQLSDITETRDALRTQIDALDSILKRNERALSQMTERANAAEGQIERDKEMMAEQQARVFELKEECTTAKDQAKRSEQSYEVLKASFSAIGQGVQSDMQMLRKDMAAMQDRHRKEIAEALSKQQRLTELLAVRDATCKMFETAQTQLREVHQAEIRQVLKQIAELTTNGAKQDSACQAAIAASTDATAELARLKRLIREQGA